MASEQACRSCGQVLPLERFYRCAAVKDGRRARCKPCCAEGQRARLAVPAVREGRRTYSRQWNQSLEGQAYQRAYKRTEPYRRKEKIRRVEPRNISKVKARTAVKDAVRYGRMTKKACAVCGDIQTEAHHLFGYGPEDWCNVVWLCPEHHQRAEERLRNEREGHGTLS